MIDSQQPLQQIYAKRMEINVRSSISRESDLSYLASTLVSWKTQQTTCIDLTVQRVETDHGETEIILRSRTPVTSELLQELENKLRIKFEIPSKLELVFESERSYVEPYMEPLLTFKRFSFVYLKPREYHESYMQPIYDEVMAQKAEGDKEVQTDITVGEKLLSSSITSSQTDLESVYDTADEEDKLLSSHEWFNLLIYKRDAEYIEPYMMILETMAIGQSPENPENPLEDYRVPNILVEQNLMSDKDLEVCQEDILPQYISHPCSKENFEPPPTYSRADTDEIIMDALRIISATDLSASLVRACSAKLDVFVDDGRAHSEFLDINLENSKLELPFKDMYWKSPDYSLSGEWDTEEVLDRYVLYTRPSKVVLNLGNMSVNVKAEGNGDTFTSCLMKFLNIKEDTYLKHSVNAYREKGILITEIKIRCKDLSILPHNVSTLYSQNLSFPLRLDHSKQRARAEYQVYVDGILHGEKGKDLVPSGSPLQIGEEKIKDILKAPRRESLPVKSINYKGRMACSIFYTDDVKNNVTYLIKPDKSVTNIYIPEDKCRTGVVALVGVSPACETQRDVYKLVFKKEESHLQCEVYEDGKLKITNKKALDHKGSIMTIDVPIDCLQTQEPPYKMLTAQETSVKYSITGYDGEHISQEKIMEIQKTPFRYDYELTPIEFVKHETMIHMESINMKKVEVKRSKATKINYSLFVNGVKHESDTKFLARGDSGIEIMVPLKVSKDHFLLKGKDIKPFTCIVDPTRGPVELCIPVMKDRIGNIEMKPVKSCVAQSGIDGDMKTQQDMKVRYSVRLNGKEIVSNMKYLQPGLSSIDINIPVPDSFLRKFVPCNTKPETVTYDFDPKKGPLKFAFLLTENGMGSIKMCNSNDFISNRGRLRAGGSSHKLGKGEIEYIVHMEGKNVLKDRKLLSIGGAPLTLSIPIDSHTLEKPTSEDVKMINVSLITENTATVCNTDTSQYNSEISEFPFDIPLLTEYILEISVSIDSVSSEIRSANLAKDTVIAYSVMKDGVKLPGMEKHIITGKKSIEIHIPLEDAGSIDTHSKVSKSKQSLQSKTILLYKSVDSSMVELESSKMMHSSAEEVFQHERSKKEIHRVFDHRKEEVISPNISFSEVEIEVSQMVSKERSSKLLASKVIEHTGSPMEINLPIDPKYLKKIRNIVVRQDGEETVIPFNKLSKDILSNVIKIPISLDLSKRTESKNLTQKLNSPLEKFEIKEDQFSKRAQTMRTESKTQEATSRRTSLSSCYENSFVSISQASRQVMQVEEEYDDDVPASEFREIMSGCQCHITEYSESLDGLDEHMMWSSSIADTQKPTFQVYNQDLITETILNFEKEIAPLRHSLKQLQQNIQSLEIPKLNYEELVRRKSNSRNTTSYSCDCRIHESFDTLMTGETSPGFYTNNMTGCGFDDFKY